MEPFRRPLGVLLLAALLLLLALAIGWSGDRTAAQVGGVLADVAFIAAIGAVLVIAWRLIRPRQDDEERPATRG